MIDVSAQNEEILVYIIEHGQHSKPEPLVIIPIKITDYLKLDSGSAYIGFC